MKEGEVDLKTPLPEGMKSCYMQGRTRTNINCIHNSFSILAPISSFTFLMGVIEERHFPNGCYMKAACSPPPVKTGSEAGEARAFPGFIMVAPMTSKLWAYTDPLRHPVLNLTGCQILTVCTFHIAEWNMQLGNHKKLKKPNQWEYIHIRFPFRYSFI